MRIVFDLATRYQVHYSKTIRAGSASTKNEKCTAAGALLSQRRLEVSKADDALFPPGFFAVLEHHESG